MLDSIGGLLFTGGEDVNPAHYGEAAHPNLKNVQDERDATEIALIAEASKRKTPILAICRGIQVLNVAMGGTLIQDIPSQCPDALEHDSPALRALRTHEISIEPGSRIARALRTDKARVNSFHHQAANRVGDGLSITARSPDGIIEGLETDDPDWWVLAVQWHPEEMTDSPEPWDRGLFNAFAEQLTGK